MSLRLNPVLAVTDRTTGLTFNVRLSQDDKGQDIVTVYDARFIGEDAPDALNRLPRFTTLGQRVSALPTSSVFRQAYRRAGWWMDAGIPDWKLDAATIKTIADWLLEVSF